MVAWNGEENSPGDRRSRLTGSDFRIRSRMCSSVWNNGSGEAAIVGETARTYFA
jgi:hypothetical protein